MHRDIVMAMSKISVPIQSVEKAALVDGLKLFEAALESGDYLGNPAVLGRFFEDIDFPNCELI